MVASPKRTDPLDGVVKPVTTSRMVVLPAPFGTDEPDDFAGLDREAHAVDRNDATELHDEIADRERHRRTPHRADRRDRGPRRRRAGSAAPRSTRRSAADRSSAWPSARDHNAAMPSGACRNTRIAPRPEITASHDTMSVPDGTMCWKTTLPSAVGAPVALTMPDTHAMPPTTAYWINSTDPKTLYCENSTFVWRIESNTPPERGQRRGNRERVHLRGDDVDAERRGGALVAADREETRAGTAAPQVRDEQGDDHEHDEHEPAVALRMSERIEVDARERDAS